MPGKVQMQRLPVPGCAERAHLQESRTKVDSDYGTRGGCGQQQNPGHGCLAAILHVTDHGARRGGLA